MPPCCVDLRCGRQGRPERGGRLSLLGLLDHTCVQCATGQARASGPASCSITAGLGEAFVEHAPHAAVLRWDRLRKGLLVDRPDHGRHPGLGAAGTSESRLVTKRVGQRCDNAPAKTVAMGSFSP